jgi:hypothetical protein
MNSRILTVFLFAALAAPGCADAPVYHEPDVIEGESLKGVAHPGNGDFGHIPSVLSTKQDMPGVFSGDSELFWRTDHGPRGQEKMEVDIPV